MSNQSLELPFKEQKSPHWEHLRALAMSPDHSFIAGSGVRKDQQNVQVMLWSLDGTHLQTLETSSETGILCLLFLDPKTLLSGHQDGSLCHWDLSAKKVVPQSLKSPHQGSITTLLKHTGEDLFYAASKDGKLSCWNSKNFKKQKLTVDWPEQFAINALAMPPKGNWIALAGEDGIVRQYDIKSGKLTREMEGHNGSIHCMLLHPQEYKLITAGEDRSVRLWFLEGQIDSRDRAEKGSHDKAIRSMALTPVMQDQKGEDLPPRLITVCEAGELKIWPLHNKRSPKSISFEKGSAIHQVQILALSKLRIAPKQKPPQKFSFEIPTAYRKAPKGCIAYAVAENRRLYGLHLDQKSEHQKQVVQSNSEFENALKAALSGKKAERQKSILALQQYIEDPQVLEFIKERLLNESEFQTRLDIIKILGLSKRKKPIKQIRKAFNDSNQKVRLEAFHTVRRLQGNQSLSPFVHAFQSQHATLRKVVVKELSKLHSSSPKVRPLILEQLLDNNKEVQLATLDALEVIHPTSPKKPNPQALKIALREGQPYLKKEAIRRAYKRKWTNKPELQEYLLRLTEHDQKDVRELSLVAMLAANSKLAKFLGERDLELQRAFDDLDGKSGPKSDETSKKVKQSPKEPSKRPNFKDSDLLPLLTAQNSKFTDTALKAASYLALLKELRAFGTLLQISQDESPEYRFAAAFSFNKLGDRRALLRLAGMLNDNNEEVRDAAFEGIIELSEDSLESVVIAQKSNFPTIRNRALQQLVPKKNQALEGKSLECLYTALNDPNDEVHLEAFKILWNVNKKSLENCFEPTLRSIQANLRMKAIEEIQAFQKQSWSWDLLLPIIQDSEAAVRKKAYQALQAMKGKTDPLAHKVALSSEHSDLRLLALSKLSQYKAELIRPILRNALEDKDESVRQKALTTLQKRFPKDLDLFAETLQMPYWDLRLQTALHLAKSGDKRVLKVAEAYLEKERVILKLFLPEGARKDLERHVLKALPQEEKSKLVSFRERVVSFLLALHSLESVFYLKHFLYDENKSLVYRCMKGIVQIAPQEELTFFQEKIQDKDPIIRGYALEALARLAQIPQEKDIQKLQSSTKQEEFKRGIAIQLTNNPLEHATLYRFLDSSKSAKVRSLFLAFSLLSARKGEAPQDLSRAISTKHAEIRLLTAEALELRNNPKAFEQFILKEIGTAIPKGSSQKEEELKAKVQKSLEEVILGLHSEDYQVRYSTLALLQMLEEPALYLEYWEKEKRLRKWPKASKKTVKKNSTTSQKEMEQLAFGVYVGVLREHNASLPQKQKALKQIGQLRESEFFKQDSLLPAIQHALNESSSQELRKSAYLLLHKFFKDEPETAYRIALRSKESDVGLLALHDLLEKEAPFAKKLILETLQSPQQELRQKAADLLPKYFDEDSLEPFILTLESGHTDIRMRAVEKLWHLDSPKATSALKKALVSEHDDLRLKAAEALAKRKQEEAFEVLVESLQSEDISFQKRAAYALIQLDNPKVIASFFARVKNDPEESVDQNMLFQALGEFGKIEAMTPLLEILEHSRPKYRRTAFNSLLQLAGPKKTRDQKVYIEILEKILQSKQNDLRQKAMYLLEELKSSKVQKLLVPLLHDRSEQIRTTAIEIICKRVMEYKEDVTPLLKALEHRDRNIRFQAAIALANNKEKKSFPVLMSCFQTSLDVKEQIQAVDALGALGESKAFKVLFPLLDPEAEEHPAKMAAAEAVGKLATPKHHAEVKQILMTYIEEDSEELQCRALIGLRFILGSDILQLYRQQLRNADGWWKRVIRQTIAEQLGELKEPEAESMLLQLLKDEDSSVQSAAFKALLSIYPENAPKPHLARFDAELAGHRTEEIRESAKIIAQYAKVSEVLHRIPPIDTSALQANIEADALNEMENFAQDNPQQGEQAHTNDQETIDLLEQGLLNRTPFPMKEVSSLLSHQDPNIQLHALSFLVKKKADKVSAPIQKMVEQIGKSWSNHPKNPYLTLFSWEQALWALRALHPQKVEKSAVFTLLHPNAPANPSAQAAIALGHLEKLSKKATEALQKASKHPIEKVRRQASWSLSKHNKHEKQFTTELPSQPSALASFLKASDKTKDLPSDWLSSPIAQREFFGTLIAQKNSSLFIGWLKKGKLEEQPKLLVLNSLARIADTKAIEILDTVKNDQKENNAIRRAAFKAWKRAVRRNQKDLGSV